MAINDGDTEIARVLRSTDEEWHAHIATQGLDWDTEEANLRLFYEPPTEVMERALFGASLDDIMNLSEFVELELDRWRAASMQCDDSMQTREPVETA
jgi:hypothetical protein